MQVQPADEEEGQPKHNPAPNGVVSREEIAQQAEYRRVDQREKSAHNPESGPGALQPEQQEKRNDSNDQAKRRMNGPNSIAAYPGNNAKRQAVK